MSHSPLRTTIIFACGLATMYAIGAFFPTIFSWGFHFLGFLPKSFLVLYGILAAAGLVYILRGNVDRHIERLSQFMNRRPIVFLLLTIGAFIGIAVILRVRVPLLGDSFIAIKIYSRTALGIWFLPNSHQPLALYFFYFCMKWLGMFNFPEILNAFLAGELLLTIGFILASFFIIRNLFENPIHQCLSFLLLLTLPYMQLFFGYVELYSVVLFFLSAYVLMSVLYLREKIHFAFVPVAFTFLLLAHYLNALLLPSLLYLTIIEYRRHRFRQLLESAGVLAAYTMIALILLDFNIAKLIPPDRGTPILTVVPSDNIFQPYTLFSPFHFIDLANLAILLCPAALFLVWMAFRTNRGLLFNLPVTRFLAIACIPIIAFIAIARFDIPMAQDWDVSSSYAYMLTLYALIAAVSWVREHHVKILGMILVVTILNSMTWFYLNASVEPNIARVKQFIDKRISSHDGCYQSTLHLTEYFIHAHDVDNIAEFSEQFINLYPMDKRGYSNYTLYLMQFGKIMDVKINGIFERWLAIDSSNIEARTQFANFHLDVGNRSIHDGAFREAIAHYQKAIALIPNFADAYNSLGIAYRKIGNDDGAAFCYHKAIELDRKNLYAYINLGNLYDDHGHSDSAITMYREAVTLQPNSPSVYYNLGIAYFKIGAYAESAEAIKYAARAGMPEAQAFLREHGETW